MPLERVAHSWGKKKSQLSKDWTSAVSHHTELRGFVYLASLPYSGSTLLSFLVNSHPQIVAVGEGLGSRGDTTQEYICSCGEMLKNCEFWQATNKAMRDQGFEFNSIVDNRTRFDLGNTGLAQRLRTGSLRSNRLEDARDMVMRIWPGHVRQIREIVARNHAFACSVTRVSGKPIFFDASKHHMAIKYLHRYPMDVDFRVVHLVRDPRGGVASIMRHHRELSLRQAINRWKHGNLNIERQLEAIPADKWLRVRYEDVCTDTQAVLNRLCRFSGADDPWQPASSSPVGNHIVGNYMRLANSQEIRLDQRWRQALNAEQLDKIKSMLSDLSNRYGYCLDNDVSPDATSASRMVQKRSYSVANH